jgi:hypothetical protein
MAQGLQPTTFTLGPDAAKAINLYQPIDTLRGELALAKSDRADISKKEETAQTALQEKKAPLQQGIQTDFAKQQEMNAKGPEHKEIPDAPKFTKTDIQGTMGLLMAMAAFSGVASRQPLTASLNALAGLVEGVNKGDQQKFENSYKEWDANTKKVMSENKQYLDKFNRIMKNGEISISQKQDFLPG